MPSDRCLSCLSVTLVHCGQTVGRIKMKLGMQVGLGPGHIVLGRDPAPPIFGLYLLWRNGSMDQDVTWYGGRHRPRPHCVRWESNPHFCCGETAGWIKMQLDTEVGLASGYVVVDGAQLPPRKGHSSPPHFSAHVYCGQMVAHLGSC